jgi:hypothetical protein
VPAPDSGFLGALAILSRAGVDFVVVGTGGINFFARDASTVAETDDVDVLLRPDVTNLGRALTALDAAGFELWARDERFLDFGVESILRNVVRAGACIRASDADGNVDLMLSGIGLSFDDLASDAALFRFSDFEIRVGRLDKLLRSKELAGRPKDVAFLTMFAARLREEAEED